MSVLTPEMKEMVANFQCFVATTSPEGIPNVGPKRSTRVFDDEHLAYSEVTGKQTWANVQSGSKVAIAVADRETRKGYRFVGTPEAIMSGELFDQTQAMMRQMGMMAPLKAVIKVRIEKIYNLGTPGAGEQIG